MAKTPNPKSGSPQKSTNSVLIYTGLGFQMAAVIGVMAWLGDYIDDSRNASTPVFTIVLSLFGITASLYLVFKNLINKG